MTAGSPSNARRWLAAWLGGVGIGVGNGIVREATYGRRLSETAAHQVSTVTAIAGFGAYFAVLQKRWPLGSPAETRTVGLSWLVLTIAFEFTFGRLVAKQSWRALLADYNIARGRTWPLVLVWIATGPETVRRLRG